MAVSKARFEAYRILRSETASVRPLHDLVDTSLDERDSSFAEMLINGVRSYKPLLDLAIQKSCSSGTRISAKLRTCLQISTYELLYLNKVPHVAVNEGVEIVKSVDKYASGLANVVLKNVSRLSLSEFPEYLQHGFSEEVFRILVGQLGNSGAINFMELSDMRPKSECIDGIYANASSVEIAKSVADRLKDATSFLEVGAGRGTKTALFQHFIGKEAVSQLEYDILELSEDKVIELKDRARRQTLKIDRYICDDAQEFATEKKYDMVFVDAPCSGLGTIRKHREVRWRITSSGIEDLHNVNVDILKNMYQCVKTGGVLVYSTCTVTHAENMGVIDNFLSSEAGKNFKLQSIIREPKLTETSDAHFCVELKSL